jgi:murein DD-endopeptidase MepM/ murein hydrolase activator NlpD
MNAFDLSTPEFFGRIAIAMSDLTGIAEFKEFNRQLARYITKHAYRAFFRFEAGKDIVAGALYHKRGKYARPFVHSAMMAIIFFAITLGPKFVQASFNGEAIREDSVSGVSSLGVSLDATGIVTLESEKPWNQISEYTIKEGDTLSSIASKFGVSIESVKWANPNINWQKIKPDVVVSIPPVTGVVYKVKPGDTVYSIAKKFQTDAQGIVDFPMNTFSDDETFALVAGQTLIVPDGIMPDEAVPSAPNIARVLTPDAGSVKASGSFAWPGFGRLTQPFRWYHKGVDIANHDGGAILASDAGTVVVSGWTNSGYGNHIIIDHGNGFQTLYGHLSVISVVNGQRVNRGAVIGQMGNTGRSTGTHLHFEVRTGSGNVDPMGYLK